MVYFGSCLIALWALSLLTVLYGTWLALNHYRREKSLPSPVGPFPPITLLKPLKGLDPGLRENLHGFFQLDYPEYEILFSVADAMDPARPMVESLLREFPAVPARLIVGDEAISHNPKVNNMARGYAAARYDWILVSDSNIRVKPDYLKRLSAALDQNTGMLSAAVTGLAPKGVGGHLEAALLNTFYARWMKLCFAFGHPTVIGKSMMFRKSLAERFGGLKVMGRYLAEDYIGGLAMQRLGYRVVLLKQTVKQYLGRYSVKDFWSRHLRWGRLRKSQAPLVFMIEPASSFIGSGLIGAWGFHIVFGFSFGWVFLAHTLLWGTADLWMMAKVGAQFFLLSPFYWLLREALAFPLWCHIAIGHSVVWRGKKLNLLPGGLIE